jgi:hypothetical protein
MGIFFLILAILLFLGFRYLARHPEMVMRWMMRRAMKHQQNNFYGNTASQQRSKRSQRRQQSNADDSEVIIPKEYAEDVSFREERVEKPQHKDKSATDSFRTEEQVSDAEWEEI